jgi:hypothetical protein
LVVELGAKPSGAELLDSETFQKDVMIATYESELRLATDRHLTWRGLFASRRL